MDCEHAVLSDYPNDTTWLRETQPKRVVADAEWTARQYAKVAHTTETDALETVAHLLRHFGASSSRKADT